MTTSAADWPKVTLPCSEEETAWGSLRAALIYRLVATGVFDSLVCEVLTLRADNARLRARRAVVCKCLSRCHHCGKKPIAVFECACSGTGAVFEEGVAG